MTLSPDDADRIRTVHDNLGRCANASAITAHMGATAQAWAPLSDEFAKALSDVTAIHHKRLGGEIDAGTAEVQVERVITSATGEVADMFGGSA